MIQLLPGFGGGGAPAPQPLPTAATPEDPSVKTARDKLRMTDAMAKGRRATTLVDDEETLGEPVLAAAGARSAQVLG